MRSRTLTVAVLLLAASTALAADWPQWRGPDRTGVSKETGLLKKWDTGGPPKAWTVSGVGGGYGSPIIADGKIYGTGKIDNPDQPKADPKDKKSKSPDGKEVVWCRKESDGSPIWETPFADFRRVGYEQGPRCTPTYHVDPKLGPVVYAVGVSGDLVCVKAATGEILWRKSYVKDFGGSIPGWGYCESVLIDGNKLICTPGSAKAAFAALNATTGEVIWQAVVPNIGGAFGYSSSVKATISGVPMYLNVLGKNSGVVGVHAETGKFLWRYEKVANGTANIPTVVVKDDLVFFSTGYDDGGAALLRVKVEGEGATVEEVKRYTNRELQNHHGGMVLVGDYLYFGHAHGQGNPVCVEFKTGSIVWGPEKPPPGCGGSAAIVAADGMLYFRYQNAKVVLMEASPKGMNVTGSFEIPEKSGRESWQHPVIANGKLYLRDQDKLHCFDVKAK